MGYVPDWTRQNMKKTGSSGPTTKESRKDMGSLFHSSPAPQHKSATKPMYLADGDTEETYKARGAEASSGDNVGFFERLRMGNIDQPGSEAYNRFGAGRGKEVETETTRMANRASTAADSRSEEPVSSSAGDDDTPNYGRDSVRSTPVGMGDTPSRPAARRGASSSVSGSSSKASAPAKSNEELMRAYKPRYTPPVSSPKVTTQARPARVFKSLAPEDDYTKIR